MKRLITVLIVGHLLAYSAASFGQTAGSSAPQPRPTGSDVAASAPGAAGSSSAPGGAATASAGTTGASASTGPGATGGASTVGPARPDAPNPHGPGGLSTFADPLKQPSGDAVLEGHLVFKSKGDAVLEGIDVRLFAFTRKDERSQRAGEWRTVTGPDGRFRFERLSPDPSLKYITSALFQGVVYLAEGTSFAAGAKTAEVEVPVYASMAAPGPLTIQSMHIILQPTQAGGLQITEVTALQNPGEATLIGGKDDTITLRMDMPKGATNFQVLQGLLPTQVFVQEDSVAYSGPIYPGVNQIVLGYEVPPQEAWIFRRRLPVATDVVDVFVPIGGPAVLSPQFEHKEPIQLQGATFDRYGAGPLAAGGGVSFQIGGAASGSSSRSSLPAVPIATVVGLGLLAFVAWPLLARRGAAAARREAMSARERRVFELARERDKQMEFVKEVDFDFESGKLSEADHQKLRDTHKRLAIRAMQLLVAEGVPEDIPVGPALASALAGGSGSVTHGADDASRSSVAPGSSATTAAGLPGATGLPTAAGRPAVTGRPTATDLSTATGGPSIAAGPSIAVELSAAAELSSAAPGAQGRFCTECGTPTHPEDKFCGSCGYRLRVANG